MRILRWALLPVIALAAACSSDPKPNDQGSIPQVDTSISKIDLFTGQTFQGPPQENFKGCNLYHHPPDVGLVGELPATFVLRVPDEAPAQFYGAGPAGDVFTLPFPTPWISDPTQGAGCWPGPSGVCAPEPKVYEYEHALWNAGIGMVGHEFLVARLSTPKEGTYQVTGSHLWFYNGTTQEDVYDAMQSITSQYASSAKVEAQLAPCVYVLQVAPNGTLIASGFHGQIAQVHDPINWPN
jgi:hypothetical protein